MIHILAIIIFLRLIRLLVVMFELGLGPFLVFASLMMDFFAYEPVQIDCNMASSATHSSATVGPASASGSVRHGRHGQPRSTTHRPDAVPYAANAPPCDTATGPVGEASWRAQKSWTGRGVARASSKEAWRETVISGGRGGCQRAPRRGGEQPAEIDSRDRAAVKDEV